MSHHPGEACGVFGAFSPDNEAARLTYFGLFALQHRGQESAGIAASAGETVTVYKDLGLVAQVFDERRLAGLPGHIAIGHTRYSTTGSNSWANAQPAFRQVGEVGFALGHNGNLTNTRELAAQHPSVTATTDSELMAEAVADRIRAGFDAPTALAAAAETFQGAFSLVAMDQAHLIALRDPHGFRPLCIGELPGGGWVVSSETAGIDIVGARLLREVAPGELVTVGADGIAAKQVFEPRPNLCLFEFVYFARPDSIVAGASVHRARTEMGRRLAVEAPAEADVVVPVPESGIPAAQGYAAASGITYADGLVKNRYVGRTFIEPAPAMRDRGIGMKLNPLPDTLDGRRIVLVDDSIVRGTTTRRLVRMIRDAGAAEVHLRISSPPYRWPCFYGMDTADRSALIAATGEVPQICRSLEADSLAYLSLRGLIEATGADPDGFCTACLSGDYPTDIDEDQHKLILEQLR